MARGVAFGRPSKLREDQKDAVRDLAKNGSVHLRRSQNIQRSSKLLSIAVSTKNRPYGPSPFLSALDPYMPSATIGRRQFPNCSS